MIYKNLAIINLRTELHRTVGLSALLDMENEMILGYDESSAFLLNVDVLLKRRVAEYQINAAGDDTFVQLDYISDAVYLEALMYDKTMPPVYTDIEDQVTKQFEALTYVLNYYLTKTQK